MIALILAAATSTLAAPTPALKPLELTNLNAGIYSASMPTTALFSFGLKDPNTNTETTCSGYWYVRIFPHLSYCQICCPSAKEFEKG
jgi:hypothetical protein